MSKVRIKLPPKLIPIFQGKADIRGAHGGRGSSKTRTFATMAAWKGIEFAQAGMAGVIVCGREFQNSLADSSFAEIKAAIQEDPELLKRYDLGDKYIRTLDRNIDFVFAGLRHNLGSIKSKSRIRLLWVDEAETVSEYAWEIIMPTVREEGSEIWVTWNPELEDSATHKRFRVDPPDGSKIVEMNWRDNPWFPARLKRQRLEDKKKRPESYEWIWGGGFRTYVEGAYWSADLLKCKEEGRIGKVEADPLMTYRAFWDIGGTGAKADATSIWIAQFVGKRVNVLDHYTAQGQPLSTHIDWLKSSGYGEALCVLPHDGKTKDRIHSVSFESALGDAGFSTAVIPNQGTGAAKMRVEAARDLFDQIWFHADTTEAGRRSLGWYHEKKDEQRGIGLGPDHDWSSHDADSFGLMCVAHNEQTTPVDFKVTFAM